MLFKKIALFTGVYLMACSLQAQLNRYGLPFIHNYHYAETGGGEQNWGITQDQRGLIYVANNDNGILEYDGSSWRTYPVPGEVAVRSVVAGEDGFIYSGLDGDVGRLVPDLSGSLHYKSLLDSAQRSMYSGISFWRSYDVQGKVYFCGRTAILVYDVALNEISVIDLPGNAWLSFFVGDQLFTSDSETGLLKYTGLDFVPVKGAGQLSGMNISGLVPMGPGRFLISTFFQKLYLLDTLQGTIDSTFVEPGVMDELVSSRMIYMRKLDKDIYVGTRENGLFVLSESGELKERISMNEGLLDNAVPFFIFDPDPVSEHALWIALWKGVSRVDINSPFRSVSVGPGRGDMFGSGRGEQITDVDQFGGDLYVSTQSGLVQHPQNSDNMRFRPVRGIRGGINDLQAMEPVAGITYLMAAGDNRTFVIDQNRQISFIPVGGRKLLVDGNDPGLLYTGLNQLHAFRFKDGAWEETLNVDIQNEILDLCQDGRGRIWISTRRGLLRLDLQGEDEPALQYYGTEDGLPSGPIEVFTDPDDQELLAGSRNGFYRYDKGLDSLMYDSLYNSILPEGRNSIRTIHSGAGDLVWFSFESDRSGWNILAARRAGSRFQKVYERLFHNLNPRVPTDVFYTDPENELWFSKANELIHFDESRASETRDSFEVVMRNVRITGDSVVFDGTYYSTNAEGDLQPQPYQTEETQPRLRHLFREIEFSWSAPHFRNERQIRYAYYLEGFSEAWSDWSRERSTKFTNLPHGKYVMQIKAMNVFGDESQVSAYAFTILRPWYATVPAILLYLVLLGSLLIFVILYTRNLRSRAELLEKKNREIESQKVKLEHLNEEITTQRDSISEQKELIDRQKNAMTDSIYYARRIQDAVLPSRDVLRYLLPKHFVFYRPRDIVSGDFFWVDKRDETVLIAVADCTGHGVPGAFMSMLGISLLNEISSKYSGHPTNEILDELRDQVIASLGQTGDRYEARDGMEMGLVALNTSTRELQFTGAMHDLWTFQSGKLAVIKGDRMPVGIHSQGSTAFTAQKLTLKRGDTLYLFSDGYADQFGGTQRKKFGSTRLKKLLTRIQANIMHDQQEIIEKEFDQWKGEEEQIDDVLMIGVKV
jgi:serine phosphatase RsbU (regulator of sigma subunit)